LLRFKLSLTLLRVYGKGFRIDEKKSANHPRLMLSGDWAAQGGIWAIALEDAIAPVEFL
jgi:hypothetical protein